MDGHHAPSQDDIRTKRAINVYWTLGALLGIAGLLYLLTVPATRGRVASKRSQSKNRMKQIGLAFHNYHDSFATFPDEALGHSWATQLLPYIDAAPLYDSMDLSQPWSAPANEASAKQTVSSLDGPYDFPRHNSRGYALSHYAGNSNFFVSGSVPSISEVADGTSNTIMAGEVADGFVPWAQPGNLRDPALGLNTGSGSFGHPRKGGGAQFLMGDGRVIFISKDVDPAVLKALSTPAEGETVPQDY